MNYINLKLDFNLKHLEKVINLLSATSKPPRLIGGCVRDKLLNYPTNDIDLATPLLPEEVIHIFKTASIKIIPTGIKYGTVTAIIEDEKFEITTLRQDIECFGRDVKVEFTNDFEVDASRRDFTINALSYSLHEQRVYDYFGGLADLKNARVAFVGNPIDRIHEDYLRILRFFRFSARYANPLDKTGYNACLKLKHGLKLLSRERILSELDRIINLPNSVFVLKAMDDGQFFQEIDPKIIVDIGALEKLGPLSDQLKLLPTLATYYALLFHQIPRDQLQEILINLRMTNKTIHDILEISSPILKNITSILYNTWFKYPSLFEQQILYHLTLGELSAQEAGNIINKFKQASPDDFPIDGNILIEHGFTGIGIKKMLKYLRLQWIDSNFTLSKDNLVKLAQDKHD